MVTMSDSEPVSRRAPREEALSELREALASIESVPAVALDEEKLELLRCARDDVMALESAVTNEVEQQRQE